MYVCMSLLTYMRLSSEEQVSGPHPRLHPRKGVLAAQSGMGSTIAGSNVMPQTWFVRGPLL